MLAWIASASLAPSALLTVPSAAASSSVAVCCTASSMLKRLEVEVDTVKAGTGACTGAAWGTNGKNGLSTKNHFTAQGEPVLFSKRA